MENFGLYARSCGCLLDLAKAYRWKKGKLLSFLLLQTVEGAPQGDLKWLGQPEDHY